MSKFNVMQHPRGPLYLMDEKHRVLTTLTFSHKYTLFYMSGDSIKGHYGDFRRTYGYKYQRKIEESIWNRIAYIKGLERFPNIKHFEISNTSAPRLIELHLWPRICTFLSRLEDIEVPTRILPLSSWYPKDISLILSSCQTTWNYFRDFSVDLAIILYPLGIPNYVILWILQCLDTKISERKRIALIQNVIHCCERRRNKNFSVAL